MKRRQLVSTAALTSIGAACAGSHQLQTDQNETPQPMTISNSESFVLHSNHVGDSFQISVAIPSGFEAKPITAQPPHSDLQRAAEIMPSEMHTAVSPVVFSGGLRWLFGKEGDLPLAPSEFSWRGAICDFA